MSISREELEQVFKEADFDRDGFVSITECLIAGGQGHPELVIAYEYDNTDKDAKLSLEEFLKFMERFKEL